MDLVPYPQIGGDGSGVSQYTEVKELGSGAFGQCVLLKCNATGALIAVKKLLRGPHINEKRTVREIVNHKRLNHRNVVRFLEVFLTPTHLCIAMEYCAGGELLYHIMHGGRLPEDVARYFFQQLISGVDHCHHSGVFHRDLKLENIVLDGRRVPSLKICDFGTSKSALDSQPHTYVGTPAYMAPELFSGRPYSGETADVWSCGVTLYTMVVGCYPFEDPADRDNVVETHKLIMAAKYSFHGVQLSHGCKDLLARIFLVNPQQRITIPQIREHPWFRTNLPPAAEAPPNYPEPYQSEAEITQLVNMATHMT